MNRKYILAVFLLMSILFVNACGPIGNPFVGDWAFGSFQMNFKSDKSFELSIGKTVSVKVSGKYEFDKNTLTLDIEGDSKYLFSYEFKDGDKTLILKPQDEFVYINSAIELTRQ